MKTVNITINRFNCFNQVINIAEDDFSAVFHSEAGEIKGILHYLRSVCRRKYGFSFGRVRKVKKDDNTIVYEADVIDLN